MSTKATAVKNYINDCGTNTQIFVFAGYDPNASESNSTQSSIDLWNYSDFAVRVGKNSLCAVVPNIRWTEKKPYTPWSSVQPNSGNFYAYNDQNNYVYLCVSDNVNNRKDIGSSISNIRPTHVSGIQRYSDGYAWKPLYKITPSFQRFITSSWLPVISFETFDNSEKVSQLKITQNFCTNAASTGETGSCGIYAKIPLSTDDDSGTIEYQVGDLFTTTTNITCSDCHYLMYLNEKFKSVFYASGQTIPDSIEILDNYTLVGNLIQTNQLSQSSPYYYLYNINTDDNINEGSIISAFIDLSNFTTTQLIVTSENPELEVISNTGTGGRIRLKTTIYNGSYIINGIEVLDPGSYYKDITVTIDSSVISVDSSVLVAAITINLDTIDGLAFDPITVLGAEHVMIDSRIEKKLIENSSILTPETLNFFGMVENPYSETVSTGNQWVSGSDYNVKDDIIFRTTVKARVSNVSAGLLPEVGESYDINDLSINAADSDVITSGTTKNILIGGVAPLGSTSSNVEMKNLLYKKNSYLPGVTMSTTGKLNTTIQQILAVPEFVQYSGRPVSVKKVSNELTLSDTDSVIIRINMVKGM